jgi:hypothetical protein
MTIRASNKRAAGKRGIRALFHAGRSCPALPERRRSATSHPMKLLAHFTIVFALMSLSFVGCTTKTPAQPQHTTGVALPSGDPLMVAIEQRFGRPDRVTGSGRAFLHYDLSNGDVVTLVVSGSKIIGLQHGQKQK